MATLAFTAAEIFTPAGVLRDGALVARDGRIETVGPRAALPPFGGAAAREVALGAVSLAAGYVDIHVHGGAGRDVMEGGDALPALGRHLARHGVTAYCPTTMTAPLEPTLRALESLARGMARAEAEAGRTEARPLGLHLEGPFLSHRRRGAHPPELLLPPSPDLLGRFWEAAAGRILVLTIAPELPGALETIAAARARGIRVSLGHSDANLAQTEAAIAAGATQCTHTFNAMPPLDHRVPNLLAAALGDPRLRAELIADGVHAHPLAAAALLRAKGAEGVMLVSDAISATGMGDGEYRLGPLTVRVRGDRCQIANEEAEAAADSAAVKLAGSVLTLDRAARNAAQFAGWTLAQAAPLASANPARALGLDAHYGVLRPGAAADFIALSPAGDVVATYIAGQKLAG